MEYYTAVKINQQIHITTQLNLPNIVLNKNTKKSKNPKKLQTHKNTFSVTSFELQ